MAPADEQTDTMEKDRKRARKRAKRRRIKKTITGIAPQIAEALGGPLAGTAVETLSEVLFGKPDAAEDEIDAVLETLSPQQIEAIRAADLAFEQMVSEAAIAQAKIAADDRADARFHQRTMEDKTASRLGALIIIGFFVVLAVMVTQRLPTGAETEFSIMLGALATMTAAVVNYFFGSSAGSKEKTRLMSITGKVSRGHDN